MKTVMMVLVCLGVVLSSGCNTVQGVGEDVQSGGRAIQHAAS